MKQQVIKLFPALIVAIGILFVLAIAVPVYAVENSDDTTTESTEVENETESPDDSVTNTNTKRAEVAAEKKAEIAKRRTEAETKAVAQQDAVQVKLVSKRLETCQKREAKVQNTMKRIGELGDKQLTVFNKIATRTMDFYTTKGYTLANYAELEAAVATTKSAAEAQVAATKQIGAEFSCDAENPLGTTAAFKASLETQKAAMKAYKTAVKNLIVGVKSVAVAEAATDTETTDTSNDTTQGGTTNE